MSVDGNWNIVVSSPMGDQPTHAFAEGRWRHADRHPRRPGPVQPDRQRQGRWRHRHLVELRSPNPFPMTLEFTGTVAGDTLNGNVKAGSFGSFPFKGSRA